MWIFAWILGIGGSGVTGAYVHYTFDDNGDSWWWYDQTQDDYGEFVSDGTGTTTDKGHVGSTLRDPDPSLTGPYDYIVNAQVTDAADQTLSASRVPR